LKEILFNKGTDFCVSFDRPKGAFEYSVLIPYPIQLSKTIQENTGNQIQKVNDQNELLFKTNIKTTTDEFGNEVITYDSTTENQTVISYEEVTNTYRIQTDTITHEETVTETIITGYNEVPVTWTDEEGIEHTEIQQVPITEEVTKTILVEEPVYETMEVKSQIPNEVIPNEPIMVDEIITKTITLQDSPFDFSYEEILEAKKQSINNNNILKLIHFDEDFLQSNIQLTNISIADGILIFHKDAEAKQEITLPNSTSTFEIYTEIQPDLEITLSTDGINYLTFEKNAITLENLTDKVYLKIKNNASSNRELYCIGLLGGIA
jgi:hypothetical protein